MTVRPALERSSATTLWIRAHCSPCAPGGVSQRICQSPWTDRTAPCAPAGAIRPSQHTKARLEARPAPMALNENSPRIRIRKQRNATELVGYFEGPIRVDPLIFLWLTSSATSDAPD